MNRANLKSKSVPVCKRLGTEQSLSFPQHNNAKHTAKAAIKWFTTKNMSILQGLIRSRDLNPMKNMWQDLKIAVSPLSASYLTIGLSNFAKTNIRIQMYAAYRDVSQKTDCNCSQKVVLPLLEP